MGLEGLGFAGFRVEVFRVQGWLRVRELRLSNSAVCQSIAKARSAFLLVAPFHPFIGTP